MANPTVIAEVGVKGGEKLESEAEKLKRVGKQVEQQNEKAADSAKKAAESVKKHGDAASKASKGVESLASKNAKLSKGLELVRPLLGGAGDDLAKVAQFGQEFGDIFDGIRGRLDDVGVKLGETSGKAAMFGRTASSLVGTLGGLNAAMLAIGVAVAVGKGIAWLADQTNRLEGETSKLQVAYWKSAEGVDHLRRLNEKYGESFVNLHEALKFHHEELTGIDRAYQSWRANLNALTSDITDTRTAMFELNERVNEAGDVSLMTNRELVSFIASLEKLKADARENGLEFSAMRQELLDSAKALISFRKTNLETSEAFETQKTAIREFNVEQKELANSLWSVKDASQLSKDGLKELLTEVVGLQDSAEELGVTLDADVARALEHIGVNADSTRAELKKLGETAKEVKQDLLIDDKGLMAWTKQLDEMKSKQASQIEDAERMRAKLGAQVNSEVTADLGTKMRGVARDAGQAFRQEMQSVGDSSGAARNAAQSLHAMSQGGKGKPGDAARAFLGQVANAEDGKERLRARIDQMRAELQAIQANFVQKLGTKSVIDEKKADLQILQEAMRGVILGHGFGQNEGSRARLDQAANGGGRQGAVAASNQRRDDALAKVVQELGGVKAELKQTRNVLPFAMAKGVKAGSASVVAELQGMRGDTNKTAEQLTTMVKGSNVPNIFDKGGRPRTGTGGRRSG